MELHVALRHAVSRHGDHAPHVGIHGVDVRFTASVDINGEGVRRRHIGPVHMTAELATPIVHAVLSGDDAKAARDFELAFAESYGVVDVTIRDVSQLMMDTRS